MRRHLFDSSIAVCTLLCFDISLEHAASKVSRPNLKTSDTTIIHLVEPLVCGLFNSVFIAVLALLFSKVQSVFHLLVEGTAKCRSWLVCWFTLGSQMVFGQIRLRFEQLVVFLLCDRWVNLLHVRHIWHFSAEITIATPQGVAVAHRICRWLCMAAIATVTAPLLALLLSYLHRVHVL